jgi:hypothetical protein
MPLTQHALDGHPDRSTGPAKIQALMASGACSPVEVWDCWMIDQLIVTCPAAESANPNMRLGLFVGRSNPQIITGYPSDRWGLKTFGCSGPVLLP